MSPHSFPGESPEDYQQRQVLLMSQRIQQRLPLRGFFMITTSIATEGYFH